MKTRLYWVAVLAAAWSVAPVASAQDEEVPPEEPAPEILRCDEALSCPSPLFCDEEAEGGPYCSYEPIECAATADCPEHFECIDGALLSICETCDGEGNCELTPCEEHGPNQCEPERIDCTADADCPTGWRCVELYLQWLPAHWDPPAEGDVGCLSEGTIALGEGRVYLPFVTLETGSGPADTGVIESTVDPNLEDSMTTSAPAEMGSEPKAVSSGGCSVGALGSGTGGLSSLLALLGLALVRRRRA